MKMRMLIVLLICCLCAGCGYRQAEVTEDTAAETVETFEDSSPRRIVPLPCTVDLNQVSDCTLAVSLEKEGLIRDESGGVQLQMTVYAYDVYDAADISRMKTGDTISINRQDLLIASLEESQYGSVLINGGLENGGHELRAGEGGIYYETGFSDVKSYYELGSIALPLSAAFVYVDASDLDLGESRWPLEAFESMYEEIAFYSQPGSTSVVVEDGAVVSLIRVYVP